MEITVKVDNEKGTVIATKQKVQVGQLEFVFVHDTMSILHTYTFHGHEGQGVASALVMAATDYAVEHKLKIRPLCSYAEAWYKRHPQYEGVLAESTTTQPTTVTKVFVMSTCPDCIQVKAQLADNAAYELIDIGEHVSNLKQFMRLRDNNSAFDDAKAHGYIGIPCFLFEDGTVTFSIDDITLDETTDGSACSIDGKGC